MRRFGGALGAAGLALLPHGRRRQPAGGAACAEARGARGEDRVFDVAVIGGGLVGLAVAREAAARGSSVVLLEREAAVAAGAASSGNTGLGHTGYDAPEGSLERRLLRRAISLHPGLYRAFGLSLRHVRKCGSLVVAWTPEQLAALDGVLQENLRAGDADAYRADAEELRRLEPALSRAALGAVVCPNEAVVEPWLIPIGYAESARLHGAELRLSTEVTSARREGGAWRLGVAPLGAASGDGSAAAGRDAGAAVGRLPGRSAPGEVLVRPVEECPLPKELGGVWARTVVNCAGLFSDRVEAMRLDGGDPPFHITPRKGQFAVFRTEAELEHIVETVPSQYTKGVIVWSTVWGNVVVGPTATDQASRADRGTDGDTLARLQEWAAKVVPALKDAALVGTYSGLRTATEFRDYCIQAHPEERWVAVGGIRSTGLSACAAIGEHVADLVEGMDGAPPREVPLVGVSDAKLLPRPPCVRMRNGEVPSLAELAAEHNANNDGTVTVYGRRWHVSHPLSSFGMESYTGRHAGVTS